MRPAPPIDEASERPELPWDLSSWVDRSTLLTWVIQHVDSLDWRNAELAEFQRANPEFQPRFLLILITYAYALGICESEEVVDLAYRDAGVKTTFPGIGAGAMAISRFRRENRGLLKWGLFQCLKQVLRHHYSLGDVPLPAGLRRTLSEAASSRLDLARHLDQAVQAE